MTTTKPNVDDSLLLCPACHRHLHIPKILPCLHVFCRKCLRGHIEKTKQTKDPKDGEIQKVAEDSDRGICMRADGSGSGDSNVTVEKATIRQAKSSEDVMYEPEVEERGRPDGNIDYKTEENFYEVPVMLDDPKRQKCKSPSKCQGRHSHLVRQTPVTKVSLERPQTVYENEEFDEMDTYVTVGSLTPDLQRKIAQMKVPMPTPRAPVFKKSGSISLDVEIPPLAEKRKQSLDDQYVAPNMLRDSFDKEAPPEYMNKSQAQTLPLSPPTAPHYLNEQDYLRKTKAAQYKHWTIQSQDSIRESKSDESQLHKPSTKSVHSPEGYFPVGSLYANSNTKSAMDNTKSAMDNTKRAMDNTKSAMDTYDSPAYPATYVEINAVYDAPKRTSAKVLPGRKDVVSDYDTPASSQVDRDNRRSQSLPNTYEVPQPLKVKEETLDELPSYDAPKAPLMTRRAAPDNAKKTGSSLDEKIPISQRPLVPLPREDSGFSSPGLRKSGPDADMEQKDPIYQAMSDTSFENVSPKVYFPCPKCDMMVELPEGGVENLQSCNLLKVLQEQISEEGQATQESLICNHCENKEAKVRCLDCQKVLCDGCHDAHNWLKTNRKHKVKPLGKSKGSKTLRETKRKSKISKSLSCHKHRRKEAEMYCVVCDEMLCGECHSVHPTDHLTQSIEIVGRHNRGFLQHSISKARNTMTNLTEDISNIDNQQKKLSDAKQAIREQLAQQKLAIIAEVEKCFSAVDKSLEEECAKEAAFLAEKEAKIKQNKTNLEQRVMFSEHLVKLGKDGDIVTLFPVVKDSLKEFTESVKSGQETSLKLTYQPPEVSDVSNMNIAGTVKKARIPDVQSDKLFKSQEELNILPEGQGEPVLSYTFIGKTFKDKKGCKPTGITLLPNNCMLIVDDINKKIKQFDLQGHLLWECCPEDKHALVDPWDIAVLSEDSFVVTDRDPGKVKLFHFSGDFISEFGDNLRSAWGVAVNSRREILVTDALQQKVFLHSNQGKVLLTLPSKSHDKDLFKCPEYVAVDQDDAIIVSDFEKHSIIVFDTLGRLLFTFGTRGNGIGNLYVPCGVCTDDQGDILVADYNNQRVVKISRNGEHLGSIVTWNHGLFGPQAVTWTNAGDVIVLDRSDVKIYKFGRDKENDKDYYNMNRSRSSSVNNSLSSLTGETAEEPQFYDVPTTMRREERPSIETEV